MIRITWVLLVLAMAACSGKKTDQELYEKETSGLIYATYKASSRVAVGAVVKVYNAQRPDSTPAIRPELAHTVLGYIGAVGGKSVVAFAEAAILEETKDPEQEFIASSLRSITMYQQGWNTLARAEGQKANTLVQKSPSSNIKDEATVFYLVIAVANVYSGQFEEAKFYWSGFAVQTDIHWPYALTDAAADLRGGAPQRGLKKLKIISQDPAVPESLREVLADRMTLLEAHTGNVESPLFWPRLISLAVLEELKRASDEGFGKLLRMLEDVEKKLS